MNSSLSNSLANCIGTRGYYAEKGEALKNEDFLGIEMSTPRKNGSSQKDVPSASLAPVVWAGKGRLCRQSCKEAHCTRQHHVHDQLGSGIHLGRFLR
jgi:hypothetical protein